MRKVIFLMLVIPAIVWSQVRPVGVPVSVVGSATTAWAKVFVRTGEKDLTIYNRDTVTDTLKVAFTIADTGAAAVNSGRALLICAGEAYVFLRYAQDSVWVKGSGTVPYTITGVTR